MFLLACMSVHHHVHGACSTCGGQKRALDTPGTGDSVVRHHEDAGTQTQTLWKSIANPPTPPPFLLRVVTEALVYDGHCVMC